MSKIQIGINGFGRIGRQVFKAINERYGDEIEVVAVNDLTDIKTNAHLLKYDSTYGKYNGTVEATSEGIVVNGNLTKVLSERDPGALPWGDLGVDVVIESTGVFRDANDAANGKPGARSHITRGGAKKVIISAPAKNEDITVVLGVNDDQYDAAAHDVVSNASCTTNCLAPAAKVVLDNFGIERGLMATIHGFTNDQRILDTAHSDLRRSRTASTNIIPTTTGAAKAVGLVLPELVGKIDGYALRVPVVTGSIVDLTVQTDKDTTLEEIIAAFRAAADGPMKGILDVSDEPLVSSDYIGNPFSSTIDVGSCMQMGPRFFKIVTWYDNEWGYSCRTADLAAKMAKNIAG